MLTERAKLHAVPSLLLIAALALIFGSKYLGEFSNMSYIAFGALFYLAIKALSDFRAANRAVYIRFEEPPMRGPSSRDMTVSPMLGKDDLLFRVLYDAALMDGKFAFAQERGELFRRNNVVTKISKAALIKAVGSKRKVTVPLSEAKMMETQYSSIGGLLLFLRLHGLLRYLDERAV